MSYLRRNISTALRLTIVLSVSCITMAVSCPHPGPDPVQPVEPQPTKTIELKDFEAAYVEGLYINGTQVLSYDEDSFQKSTNRTRKNYRIQSDDQKRYMNITYSGDIPSSAEDECACTLQYSLFGGEQTTLIVKFKAVKTSGEYIWLWNELQKTGVIVPLM